MNLCLVWINETHGLQKVPSCHMNLCLIQVTETKPIQRDSACELIDQAFAVLVTVCVLYVVER